MYKSEEEVRREVLMRVLRSLNYESTKDALVVTGSNGTRPIVVALLSDTYGFVIAQAEAHDGAANVVVPRDGVLHVLSLKKLTSAETSKDIVNIDPWKINIDSSIQMVLDALVATGGSLVTRLTATNPIELKESGDPLLIPA